MQPLTSSLLGRFLLAAPAAAVVVCIAGCGAEINESAPSSSPNVFGGPSALYPLPPDAPHGEVRVQTMGVAMLEPGAELRHGVRALHVRLIVTNADDRGAWELDTREQLGILGRWGRSRAAFANSTSGRPPLVTVVPGATVAVDLYYPLPVELQKDVPRVPLFDVLWKLRTPGKPVTERTSFEGRWLVSDATQGAGPGMEWSAWHPGWYDPFWPDEAFETAPELAPAFYREPAILDPPPAFAR